MTPTFTVVDIETTGSLPWRDKLVAIGIGSTVYRPDEGREVLAKLLTSDATVVCHSNYDLRWLILDGAPFGPEVKFHDTKVMAFLLDQTQGILGLDDLAQRYLSMDGLKKPIRERGGRILYDCSKGMGLCPELGIIPIEDVPWDEMVAYNGQDLEVTAKLYVELKRIMQAKHHWEQFFIAEEAKLSRLLVEMEVSGLPIDVDQTKEMLAKASAEREQTALELVDMTGVESFNLRSSDAVANYLYDELPSIAVRFEIPSVIGKTLRSKTTPEKIASVRDMIPANVRIDRVGTRWVYGRQIFEGRGLTPPKIKKKKGKMPKRPSTDAETLTMNYSHDPWVSKYLEWKSLNTLVTNFLSVWVDSAHNGRLHGRFDQSRTATGRLASRDPNLQNIPGSTRWNVRGLFHPPWDNGLVIGDFHGMDIRVAAHFSRDPFMVEIFRDGKDYYGVLAAAAWGGPEGKTNPNRALMKILSLSMQYSAQAGSIGDKIRAAGLGEDKAKDAGKLLKRVEDLLPDLWDWRDSIVANAYRDGFVTTLSGRRRYLPGLYSNDWGTKSSAERQCVSTVVQGSSADIMRRTLLAARDQIDPDEAFIVHQVHDEVLWQKGPAWKPELLERIRYIFDNPSFDLRVPMRFEVSEGSTWNDKGGS